MNTTDAINNLQNLINAALKAGIFSDTKSVFVIQSSLDTLVETINKLAKEPENGEERKRQKEYADGVYD